MLQLQITLYQKALSDSKKLDKIFTDKFRSLEKYELILEYVHKLNDYHIPPKEMAREIKNLGIYWENIELFARQLADTCKDCRYKHFLSLPPLKGVPKKIETKNSLEIVQVDLIVANSLLKSKGFSFIFTVKDHFSRFADAKAIRNKKSETTSEALRGILQEMGKPKVIQSDNGREFMGKFDELLRELNITHIRGRPYHPQSQGSIECFNKYFKSQLDKKLIEHCDNPNYDIELGIKQIIDFYNKNRIHYTTKITPAELFHTQDLSVKNKALENIEKKRASQNKPIIYPTHVIIMNTLHLRNDKLEYRPKRPERLAGTGIFIAPVEGGYSKIQCTKWWDTFCEVEVGEAVTIDNKSLKGITEQEHFFLSSQ